MFGPIQINCCFSVFTEFGSLLCIRLSGCHETLPRNIHLVRSLLSGERWVTSQKMAAKETKFSLWILTVYWCNCLFTEIQQTIRKFWMRPMKSTEWLLRNLMRKEQCLRYSRIMWHKEVSAFICKHLRFPQHVKWSTIFLKFSVTPRPDSIRQKKN